MTELAVSELREHLGKVIDDTRRSGEPVYVTRRGSRIAVVVDSDVYEQLVDSAEDAADRADLHAAREDDDFVPWDEVKAELGLT